MPAVPRRAPLVLTLLALGAASAAASPLEDPAEGGAVFTGPATPHASSIFLNPAALGWSGQGWHLTLGSALRVDQLSIDRTLIDADGGASDGPSLSPVVATPTGLIAAHGRVLDRGHVGVILHTPYAVRFPAAGADLGYHALGGYLYGGLLSAAGSYQVDRFIFGIGVSLSYARVRYEYLRDTALDGGSAGVEADCGDGSPCGLENPAAAQRTSIKADFDLSPYGFGLIGTGNLGLSAGIAMEIPSLDGWWLTLSYVGPPGVISTLQTEGRATVGPTEQAGGRTRHGEAEIRYRMPQSVWLALRGPAWDGWGLIASTRWQDMSRHQELDVRLRGLDVDDVAPEWQPRFRGLRDTFQAQLGLEMNDGARLRLGGRLRFETGATTGFTNSPLEVDTHNLALGLGAEWRLGQHVVVTAGYDLTAFLPTDLSSSAFDPLGRISCVDSELDYDRCEASRDGRDLPTAAGSYARLRHLITFGIRWDSL